MDFKESLIRMLESRFKNKRYAQGHDSKPHGSPDLYEPILFEGFVKIQLIYYPEYTGKNPETGDSMEVPPKYAVRFAMDEKMAAYLNENVKDIEEIQIKETFSGINVDELLKTLNSARQQLLKGKPAILKDVVKLIVKEKESGSKKNYKILALDTDREDPNDPYVKFESEVNRRLLSEVK